jgi:hypothetical protein
LPTSSPDAVFVLEGEPRTLVPPGLYQAAMVRHESVIRFGRHVLIIWFEVVAPDRVRIPMYFAMVNGKFRAGSKFSTLWARLTGRRPRRGERMTTGVLRDRLVTIKTRTVTEDDRQRAHSALATYSVVEEIVSIDVGGQAGRT